MFFLFAASSGFVNRGNSCIDSNVVSGLGTDFVTYHELFGIHLLPVRRSRDLLLLQFLDVHHHVLEFLCVPYEGNDDCNVSNADAADGYMTYLEILIC